MRIHIAIGITAENDYTALYVGDDAEAARAAIEEAGDKGRIVRGYHFPNPQGYPHKRRRFPQNVKGDAAMEAYSQTLAAGAGEDAAPKKPAKPIGKKAAKVEPTEDDPFATGKKS